MTPAIIMREQEREAEITQTDRLRERGRQERWSNRRSENSCAGNVMIGISLRRIHLTGAALRQQQQQQQPPHACEQAMTERNEGSGVTGVVWRSRVGDSSSSSKRRRKEGKVVRRRIAKQRRQRVNRSTRKEEEGREMQAEIHSLCVCLLICSSAFLLLLFSLLVSGRSVLSPSPAVAPATASSQACVPNLPTCPSLHLSLSTS